MDDLTDDMPAPQRDPVGAALRVADDTSAPAPQRRPGLFARAAKAIMPSSRPPTPDEVAAARADTRVGGDIVGKRLDAIVPEHTRVNGGKYVPGVPEGSNIPGKGRVAAGTKWSDTGDEFLGSRGPGFHTSDDELHDLWHQSVAESSQAAKNAVAQHDVKPQFLAKDWHKAMQVPWRDILWYELSGEKFHHGLPDLTPEEHGHLMDLVGATSARAKPGENLERSLGVLSQSMRNVPADVDLTIPSTVRDALARKGGGSSALAGNKTGHFSDTLSLTGGVKTRFPISVNDVWVGKMFGIPDEVMSQNQSLHEPMALYFNKLRDLYNARMKPHVPLQSWNFQAPAWVHLRNEVANANSGDAYHQVWDGIVDKLKKAGVPGVEDGVIRREALMHPKFADALRQTTPGWRDAPKATVEFGTTQTPIGAEAHRLYNQALEKGDHKSAGEYLKNLTTAMYDSARGKNHPWDLLKKAVTGEMGTGSDITRIAHPTSEAPLDIGGTFEGAVSPNIRVPLKGLSDDHLTAFNAVAGKALKQDAMAVSRIKHAEPDSEPAKGTIRGHSLFLPTTDQLGAEHIRAFAKALNEHGHDMSYARHPNGYQFDVLPHFPEDGAPEGISPARLDEAFKSSLGKVLPNAQHKIIPHDFQSVYTPSSEYGAVRQKLIKGIRDEFIAQAVKSGADKARAAAAAKGTSLPADFPRGSQKAWDSYQRRLGHLADAEKGFTALAKRVEDAHKGFIDRARKRMDRIGKAFGGAISAPSSVPEPSLTPSQAYLLQQVRQPYAFGGHVMGDGVKGLSARELFARSERARYAAGGFVGGYVPYAMAHGGQPNGYANGGVAQAARKVAKAGRKGDTMLAHINPTEAAILKRLGGSGTINPETGLPEFSFDSDGAMGGGGGYLSNESAAMAAMDRSSNSLYQTQGLSASQVDQLGSMLRDNGGYGPGMSSPTSAPNINAGNFDAMVTQGGAFNAPAASASDSAPAAAASAGAPPAAKTGAGASSDEEEAPAETQTISRPRAAAEQPAATSTDVAATDDLGDHGYHTGAAMSPEALAMAMSIADQRQQEEDQQQEDQPDVSDPDHLRSTQRLGDYNLTGLNFNRTDYAKAPEFQTDVAASYAAPGFRSGASDPVDTNYPSIASDGAPPDVSYPSVAYDQPTETGYPTVANDQPEQLARSAPDSADLGADARDTENYGTGFYANGIMDPSIRNLADTTNAIRNMQAMSVGEAGNQGQEGMNAVDNVAMNRALSDFQAIDGRGYVITGGNGTDADGNPVDTNTAINRQLTAPYQFSMFNGDPQAGYERAQQQISNNPDLAQSSWDAARDAYYGNVPDPTQGATMYRNPDISDPSWAGPVERLGTIAIGDHVFSGFNGEQQHPEGVPDTGTSGSTVGSPAASRTGAGSGPGGDPGVDFNTQGEGEATAPRATFDDGTPVPMPPPRPNLGPNWGKIGGQVAGGVAGTALAGLPGGLLGGVIGGYLGNKAFGTPDLSGATWDGTNGVWNLAGGGTYDPYAGSGGSSGSSDNAGYDAPRDFSNNDSGSSNVPGTRGYANNLSALTQPSAPAAAAPPAASSSSTSSTSTAKPRDPFAVDPRWFTPTPTISGGHPLYDWKTLLAQHEKQYGPYG